MRSAYSFDPTGGGLRGSTSLYQLDFLADAGQTYVLTAGDKEFQQPREGAPSRPAVVDVSLRNATTSEVVAFSTSAYRIPRSDLARGVFFLFVVAFWLPEGLIYLALVPAEGPYWFHAVTVLGFKFYALLGMLVQATCLWRIDFLGRV